MVVKLIQFITLFLTSLSCIIFLSSCGGKEKEIRIIERVPIQTVPQNPQGQGPQTQTGLTGWPRVQAIMNEHCALSGCHEGAGFAQNEQSFLRSDSVRRIENRGMPPSNSRKFRDWTEEIRQEVLNFARSR